MESILKKQRELQELLQSQGKAWIPKKNSTRVGSVVDELIRVQVYLNDEIREIIEAVPEVPSRDVVKPWKSSYVQLSEQTFKCTSTLKEEAIDMLCFAMNILLICGINEKNLYKEYEKVYTKITQRLKEGY